MDGILGQAPFQSWAGLFLLAGAPTILIGCTSFLKLSVVFGIFKNALGAQGVPSSIATGLLAFALTCHIMTPAARESLTALQREIAGSPKRVSAAEQVTQLLKLWTVGSAPLRRFMEQHAGERERRFFAFPQGGVALADSLAGESFFSLLPAFLITELTRGFALGVSIFLPFLVVDLLVANVLVALGMSMVSPISIALPLKLALFVICDGWFHLSRSLVLSY